VTSTLSPQAKYANRINGIMPAITNNRRLYFDAYHPILYLNNKQKQEITHPQTIELQQENRIIVISGPNAGGKQS
jgi:DNA mismatch repair protein MutS2